MNAEFCARCGQPTAAGDHALCTTRLATIDPPRFCADCGRRMVVQVTPAGWVANCSRHGERTSTSPSVG
jgi:NADH pyrophosphatase NudC (nudix superfamily)